MKLRRLQLRRLPGIETPFAIELKGGLNLIHGPNGAGKSTLARAARAALWPDTLPGRGVILDAEWTDDGAQVKTERSGRRVRWFRDGAESGPPSLPAIQIAPCYSVSLPDLFPATEDTEQEIAREIRRRMAGGYDVEQILRKRLPLQPRHGQSEKADLEEKRREYSAVQSEFRRLAEEEEELVGLRARQEVARKANGTLPALESALELAETRQELNAAKAALRGFPEGMELLQGNELDRLQDLENEQVKLRQVTDDWEAKVLAARRLQEEATVSGNPIQSADLESGEAKARRLRELEGEIKSRSEAKRQSQAALAHAWRELGGSVEAEEMHLDLPALAKLDAYLSRSEILRHTRASLESSLDLVAEGPDPVNMEALRNATDALREWLAASDLGGWWQRKWLVALLGSIGALGGTFAAPYLPEGFALGAPLGGALLLSMIPVAIGVIAKDPVWYARRRYEQSGHKAPENWSRKAVRERLKELEKKLSKAEVDREQDERRQLLKGELKKLKEQEAAHQSEREALKAALGVDPGDSALGLVDLARRVQAWRGAKAVVEESEAALTGKKQERDRLLTEINQFFERNEYPAAADAEEAEVRLENLKERARALRNARLEEEEAASQKGRTEEMLKKVQERMGAVFSASGLQAGNREELQRRIQRLAEYRGWTQKEDALRGKVRALSARLASNPELKELEADEARARLAAAKEHSAGLTALSFEVGKIQERIDQARKGRRMEDALAALAEAQAALQSRRREALVSEAGRFLLQDVEREYRKESIPGVLKRAMEWVSAFTRHNHELRFMETEPPCFRAVETSTGREVELHQLSDSTRAQFLLAIRLAFATHSESGTELPLFLDETLATCDAGRFEAVAECLLTLVERGRQIVYMTSSPGDVAHWRSLVAGCAMEEPHVVDLGEIRGMAAGAPDPSVLRPPERRALPEPVNLSQEEYAAKLHVPAPDPFGPPESLHLFHLLHDDLSLLKILMDAGIETMGQWRSAARAESGTLPVSDEAASRLNALSELAGAFMENWQAGHNRPVDREALEESGAVSERFLDGISAIASEIEGDASRLILALEGERPDEVRGFFGRQLEELRAWFEQEGYLDLREPLDEGELLSRTLEQVADRIEGSGLSGDEVTERLRYLYAVLQRIWGGTTQERRGQTTAP